MARSPTGGAPHARLPGLALLPFLAGCISVVSNEGSALADAPAYEEIAIPATSATAPQPSTTPTAAPQPFIGLELEESLAGSLDAMQFLGGLRVASVAAASPAEAAGIRAGDRIVKSKRAGAAAEALELSRVDQWSALLATLAPGDELSLTVERDGGLVDHAVTVSARGAGARLPARRFIERRKARCVVETELVTVGGRTRSAARVVELAPSSPLAQAAIPPGARLLALDGVELRGAADFARRVSELPWGSDVTLEVADGGVPGALAALTTRKAYVELYSPPRHWTAVELWPLFAWAEPADESRAGFELVDLWLIWLFKYERKGETRTYSVLRFIEWQTGVGALVEEPGAAK